jgi:hypothetical protein
MTQPEYVDVTRGAACMVLAPGLHNADMHCSVVVLNDNPPLAFKVVLPQLPAAV